MVFPLGMYSVGTAIFGRTAHLTFMEPLARVMFWVSLAAWLLVADAYVVRAARRHSSKADS